MCTATLCNLGLCYIVVCCELLVYFSDKKSCNISTTLQNSVAQFVSNSWASCTVQQRNEAYKPSAKIVKIHNQTRGGVAPSPPPPWIRHCSGIYDRQTQEHADSRRVPSSWFALIATWQISQARSKTPHPVDYPLKKIWKLALTRTPDPNRSSSLWYQSINRSEKD